MCTVALLSGCASQSQSAAPAGTTDAEAEPGMLGLDEAVRDFALYLDGRINKGALSAVLNVEAPLQGISGYITDTLVDELLNTAGARMVSRQNIETLKREQDIQAEGAVDDETAVRIGHIAGWKTVITGAVSPAASGYRLSLRAVDVETAELLGAKGYLIKSDAVLASIVNPGQSLGELSRREELLRSFTARKNDFDLRVTPAGGKAVFYDGEELRMVLTAGADCYFAVYQVDVDNRMQLILPNPYDTDNTLKAGVERVAPEFSRFDLHAPFGEERILVYASDRPIAIPEEQYEPKPVTEEYISNPAAPWQGGQIPAEGGKGLSVRPRGASAQFTYTIVPK